MTPVTLVICLSSALAPVLTVPPTSTCMMVTPATTWMATVIMASARLTSSSVLHCGAKVCGRVNYWYVVSVNSSVMVTSFFNVFHCVLQEPSQLRASALKGSTQQETPMATVARTLKAPLPNVKQGKTQCSHRNQ